ncbi:F-box/FBD/LRR-repeat protein At4g00160-like [Durio zibethinus]|uniref:F-box/FBD/LRR-repeat protein At4g00160-like n=1 Tax=Durio zibethinus TaxID=66656 RepID=A0A6P5Y9Q0_DURZI|nr:F-box/FBD/LRR-repeat protein At4g00160-like [Durio zibethinus]
MQEDNEDDYFGTWEYVNKRMIWMQRKKKQFSLSHLHLQQRTPPTPQLDRISELPDHLLHHILSFMPMQMAIQTSVLSTRWRHLWKHTQVVDFHTLPLSFWESVDYSPISRSLDLIESPAIESFTVVGHVGFHSHPHLGKWVDFALSRNVHTLRIGLMSSFPSTRFFKLPESLFTNNGQTQKLEVLFLSYMDYTPPPGVTFSGSGFASLHTLVLAKCKLDDRTVELLLLECLVLEVLVLDRCVELANVNIRGPNLKLQHLAFKWYKDNHNDGEFRLLDVDTPGLLTLIYSGDLTNIRLKNCQGFGKIILLGKEEKINEANIDHIRELINQVTQVRTLGVNSQFLQFVAKEYYMKGNPISLEFENLEHLFWYGSLGSSNDVYNLVSFIGDCPFLENCAIDFREQCWPAFCSIVRECNVKPEFVEVEGALHQLYHGGCLRKLKSIIVICFSGFDGEMMLVRLLLEKAVNLQKLELLWRNYPVDMTDNVLQNIVCISDEAPDVVEDLQEDSIKEKVNSFPKASRDVQVQFSHRWEYHNWYSSFGV